MKIKIYIFIIIYLLENISNGLARFFQWNEVQTRSRSQYFQLYLTESFSEMIRLM